MFIKIGLSKIIHLFIFGIIRICISLNTAIPLFGTALLKSI